MSLQLRRWMHRRPCMKSSRTSRISVVSTVKCLSAAMLGSRENGCEIKSSGWDWHQWGKYMNIYEHIWYDSSIKIGDFSFFLGYNQYLCRFYSCDVLTFMEGWEFCTSRSDGVIPSPISPYQPQNPWFSVGSIRCPWTTLGWNLHNLYHRWPFDRPMDQQFQNKGDWGSKYGRLLTFKFTHPMRVENLDPSPHTYCIYTYKSVLSRSFGGIVEASNYPRVTSLTKPGFLLRYSSWKRDPGRLLPFSENQAWGLWKLPCFSPHIFILA